MGAGGSVPSQLGALQHGSCSPPLPTRWVMAPIELSSHLALGWGALLLSPIPTHRDSRTRSYFGVVRKHLTFRRVHRQGHSVQTMVLCSPPAASCSPQPDRGASHIMGMGLSWCVQGGLSHMEWVRATRGGSQLSPLLGCRPVVHSAGGDGDGKCRVGWSRVIAASLQPARRRRKERRWWPCEG